MFTTNEAKAHATKLREVLAGMGHPLKHSQCLETVSKVEGYPDWNTYTAEISNNQQRAEQFLSEILEAEEEWNYAKYTQRWEKLYLVAYPEHRFLRHCRIDGEDLGKFVQRDFLGCVAYKEDPEGRYPNRVRFVWRAYYERQEAIRTLGIYCKNGSYFVSGTGTLT